MDYTNFIPVIAGWLHMTPSTLLAVIVAVIKAADVLARLIPSDATGWLAAVRKVCVFVGIHVSPRVTSGVTSTDVAKATLSFPEAQAKVDEAKDAKK